MTQPGIAPRFPGPVANTLTILPIIYIYILQMDLINEMFIIFLITMETPR